MTKTRIKLKPEMNTKKTEKRHPPHVRLFIYSLIGIIALVIIMIQLYELVHFRMHHDYKALLPVPATHEQGIEFHPINEALSDIPGMTLVTDNDILKLYVDVQTANVAIYDKRNGHVTYTNPPDAAYDPLAGGVNRSMLMSQIIVEFYDANRLPGRYNSYDYSTSLMQFSLESIQNGLRCIYTFGDLSSPTGIVPVYISRERLEFYTERMPDGDTVYMRYLPYDLVPGFMQLSEGARKGPATLRRMNASFEAAGYTEEDYILDMTASGVEGAIPISFIIPLEYRLDNDELIVTIPVREIVEKGGGMIYRLQLLRSFAAAGLEEEGYLVIPNGSGSLIRFNNGKTYTEDYLQYIYGMDELTSTFTVLGNSIPARIPYFGIYRDTGECILAEIEAGETLTLLTASVSGKLNSYNYIFPTFILRGNSSLAMFGTTGNEAELPVVEQFITDICPTVRYSFLTTEYKGYSGMARYIHEKLIRAETISRISIASTDIPLYIDLVGSVKGQKFFLSVSYAGQNIMSPYSDAMKMVENLAQHGVMHQVINYQGWFNRGYYHDVPNRIIPIRGLGTIKDMKVLADKLSVLGGKLYADVAFQRVTYDSRRYNMRLETSRYYAGGMIAAYGQVHPVTLFKTASMGYPETIYNLLSPRFLGRYVRKFNNAFQQYSFLGLSLRDLGDVLHSDKKRSEYINREEAKLIVQDSLQTLSQHNGGLLISGGNAYSFSTAAHLINVPVSHNDFYIVDDEIPFYEMIIHGCIPYAGPPVNLSDVYDETDLILRSIEYGASPHYTFTTVSSSMFKYTGLNRFYSTDYVNWRDSAVRVYHQINAALSTVYGSTILSHEILQNDLRLIHYDNGTDIFVNYSDQPIYHQGMLVNAKSWAVKEVER